MATRGEALELFHHISQASGSVRQLKGYLHYRLHGSGSDVKIAPADLKVVLSVEEDLKAIEIAIERLFSMTSDLKKKITNDGLDDILKYTE